MLYICFCHTSTHIHLLCSEDFATLPNKNEPCKPQYCPRSDFILFILHQQVISVYASNSWDPVNIVTLALCSLKAVQQASVFIG